MSTPFRERNPVTIGLVSLAVLTTLIVVALRAGDLPVIGGGDTYHARFTEAGGLRAGDEVRIAGVRVGEVQEVELAGNEVDVKFRVDSGTDLGVATEAEIRVKTLLGAMFVALEPRGTGELAEDTVIPTSRTRSPYDIVEVFEGLAERSGEIDTEQLATAFDTMATLTRNTPEEFQEALAGLSELSANVAARDAELNTLLRNLEKVSSVLGERREDIVTLMEDGDKLFRALVARRQAVHDLLVATSQLSRELTGLVRDTRADLAPALDNLQSVVDLLNRNQENLDASLRLLAPFYRVFASTLGNGPWFDTIIQNMPPAPQIGVQ